MPKEGPDYIGIGAGRSGTTSLHWALKEHPELGEFRGKEMHFWDKKIEHKPVSWYLRCFQGMGYLVSGEITPMYYRMPHLPTLLKKHLPNVKLLLLLRNPIESLFSGYRRGIHRRSFPEDFPTHVEAFLDGKGSDEFIARRYYAQHLSRWLKVFPREQMWIVQTEKLWTDPTVLSTLWDFLGVGQRDIEYPHVHSNRAAPPLRSRYPETREKLVEYFAPYNEKLYELLGERYDWN